MSMSTRVVAAPLALAVALVAGLAGPGFVHPANAAPPKNERSEFARRFAALKKKQDPIRVEMAPGDDPADVPVKPPPEGPVLVAGQRLGLYTPPVLTPEDVQVVIQQHMADVRRCYQAQLRQDPQWSDNLILDVSVKRSGRVSEVSVSPRRVRRAPIGQCMMRKVPRWRFPRFTGEVGDGITQEVVNASFPFSFGPR